MGEVEEIQVAVGDDPVPTAVLVVVGGEEVGPDLQLCCGVGPADVVDDVVALDVDVGVDLVRDLEGEGGESDSAVIGGVGQPLDLPASGEEPARRCAPEADMVALRGISLDLLLVGEVLAAAEEQQVGDGGGGVGAAQQGAQDDAPGGAQGDGIGPHPSGRCHGVVDVLLGSSQSEVDGISEQAIGGAGAADEVVGHVEPGEYLVQPGQGEVGQDRPEKDDADDEPRTQVPARHQ